MRHIHPSILAYRRKESNLLKALQRETIVSWTTPMLRAEALLRDAGEDLEFGRDEAAMEKLREHLVEVRRLVAFVQNRRVREVTLWPCGRGCAHHTEKEALDCRAEGVPGKCLFPICSCYPDTASQCNNEECTWPQCDCEIPSMPKGAFKWDLYT